MNFEQKLTEAVGVFLVKIENTSAAAQYEGDDEPTHALLFRRDDVELDEVDDEYEVWLETAEDEEADEDLILCGHHPIDEDTQVERIFFYRKSEGGKKVYAMDVDGTAVPGTLALFSDSFACFEASEAD